MNALEPIPPPQPAPNKAGVATYTVNDLAGLFQCSTRHVWRLSDLGAIPGKLRVGRLVRFSRATIDRWIADGCPSTGRATR